MQKNLPVFNKNFYFAFYYIAFSLVILGSITWTLRGYALAGSLSDPELAISTQYEEEIKAPAISGFNKIKLGRSMRISTEDFTNPDREHGLLDTLYIRYDFSLNYPTQSLLTFLQNSAFFDNTSLYFILDYKRPLYASPQEIRDICHGSHICLGDLSVGLSKAIIRENRLAGDSSFSLSFPTSKQAGYNSFLLGLSVDLSTRYRAFSYKSFHLSLISYHLLNFDWYLYDTADQNGTKYNVPLNALNQLGVQLQYSTSPFIPLLYIYGAYNFALNFKSSTFHLL